MLFANHSFPCFKPFKWWVTKVGIYFKGFFFPNKKKTQTSLYLERGEEGVVCVYIGWKQSLEAEREHTSCCAKRPRWKVMEIQMHHPRGYDTSNQTSAGSRSNISEEKKETFKIFVLLTSFFPFCNITLSKHNTIWKIMLSLTRTYSIFINIWNVCNDHKWL